MRHIAAIAAVALLGTPLAAQQDEAPGVTDEGPSLMEEGARLFFRGLMTEMEPALEDFSDFAERAGPAMQTFLMEMGESLQTIVETVDDMRNYQPPEFLPNGDIVIRRRPDAPPWTPPELRDGRADPQDEVEL